MPRRYVPVLALALVPSLLPSQGPSNASAATPAINHREPQLLPAQKPWPAQGKCEKSKVEWARVSLDIAADGSPQQVAIGDSSDRSVDDLAMRVVQDDRFTPAEQNGKPAMVHRMILVEMNTCTDKVKSPDGKKERQVWLEREPRQTLYGLPAPPPAASGIYRVGGNISPPIAIRAPMARFTDEAKNKRIQGEVMISLIVDAQGMPQNPRIVRPLPGGLNETALEAVRQYRFKPAMKDGTTPVPVMVTIAVNFRLY